MRVVQGIPLSLLHKAVMEGNLYNFRSILAASTNEDVNFKSIDQRTALHLCCIKGASHFEFTKLLILKGARLDHQDFEGNTPLHYAA